MKTNDIYTQGPSEARSRSNSRRYHPAHIYFVVESYFLDGRSLGQNEIKFKSTFQNYEN